MCTCSPEENAVIDRVIGCRRSHRQFGPDVPEKENIERILHAGLLAPFAAAAVGSSKDYFRRFFVVRNGSAGMRALSPLVMAKVRAMEADLARGMKKDPALREKAAGFARRLAMITKGGIVPGIGTAPYYIVVAERRGFPPVELQSLAHCMENMWLKATALGLGFQLVSVTSEMADDPEFCRILGIRPGEWALMGCAVGYALDELSPAIRPPVADVTTWVE
jgi:nitroreductase